MVTNWEMEQSLGNYLTEYKQICKSLSACNVSPYNESLAYTVPRLAKDRASVIDHRNYLVIKSHGKTAPAMLPITAKTPQDYYRICLEVIEAYGGIFDIPDTYGALMAKAGFTNRKRPWGELDFIYDTKQLIVFRGSRIESLRRQANKFSKLPKIEVRILGPDNQLDVRELYDIWTEKKKNLDQRVFDIDGAIMFMQYLEIMPDYAEVIPLSVWLSGRLVGVCIAMRISDTMWAMPYRMSDRREESQGVIPYMMRYLATHYFRHVPYCNDGAGTSPSNGLYFFKSRFITPSVQALQQNLCVVHSPDK